MLSDRTDLPRISIGVKSALSFDVMFFMLFDDYFMKCAWYVRKKTKLYICIFDIYFLNRIVDFSAKE